MTNTSHRLTRSLLLLNTAIFVTSVLLDAHAAVVTRYAFGLDALLQYRIDALIVSGFLHTSTAHLLYNLFFLVIFGAACEEEFGSTRTGILYGSSLVMGGLFFAVLHPGAAAVGSSGAVSGLIAAAILVAPGRDIHPTIPSFPIALLALAFIIPTTLNAFTLVDQTANIAHIGGLATGVLLAYTWKPEAARTGLYGFWPIWGLIAAISLITALQPLL